MILYNTLMGVCAGLGLIVTAKLYRVFFSGDTFDSGAFGAVFLVLGIPLTFLSGLMAVTWALSANPPINIAFAEPSLMLGILMLVAGSILLRMVGSSVGMNVSVRPASWVIFALGLVLASIASAIFSYNLVGDAPDLEPITGQFKGWENTAFGIVYSMAALGCLVLPFTFGRTPTTSKKILSNIVIWSWTISGVAFLLFSVLNYRTHIGLLINLETGTNYRW